MPAMESVALQAYGHSLVFRFDQGLAVGLCFDEDGLNLRVGEARVGAFRFFRTRLGFHHASDGAACVSANGRPMPANRRIDTPTGSGVEIHYLLGSMPPVMVEIATGDLLEKALCGEPVRFDLLLITQHPDVLAAHQALVRGQTAPLNLGSAAARLYRLYHDDMTVPGLES